MTGDQAIELIFSDLQTYAKEHEKRGNTEKASVLRFAASIALQKHSDPNEFLARRSRLGVS